MKHPSDFLLNHVALTVSSREKSKEFYSKWFDLNLTVHEDDHLLILSNSSETLLALSEGIPEVTNLRTTHFGFQVKSPQFVRELRREFSEANIIEAEWQESGPTRVQVFDPDGYRVEVFAF